ncbi:MAG TPA: response regulator [Thermoanaerobaculia bacterium]|jgi:CheY-like chemotaxis protein|nr:response regulator [Thermoanaerobaculia bacterium]
MKRRILLADDSVTIQKVIELTFMDEDYEVRAVSNGDEAVALLSEVNPDFVIADVHMPGANGYEVCRRAKQLRPDIPVLLLVGTFEPFDEGQARASGADSFLKKPFDSQELLQRVEELLASSAPAVSETQRPAMMAVPDFAAPESLPPAAAEAAPELPAEPAWGSFDLDAEPRPAPPAFSAPEPFDREPSFNLEPDPSYQVEEEPVFSLDADEPDFAMSEEVFGAPSELSFDETPQDRYIPDEPVPGSPAPLAAGFDWAAAAPAAAGAVFAMPEPEPLRFEEEPTTTPAETAPAPPAEPPAWATPDPTSIYAPAVSAPEPAFPPDPTAQPEPVSEVSASSGASASDGNGRLSDDDVDRIARRVVELLGDKAVRDVAWEVIPDMAEVIIRDRLRELESQVE